MNKLGRVLLISSLIASLVVTPVIAAPDVSAIQEQKNAAEGEVSSLQGQLTEILSKINKLENDLIEKGNQITEATKELEEAQATETEQYAAMKLRIKYMYEEGDSNFLVQLFESKSITDLLNKADYIQSVHKYDRKMLEQYTETKNKVADLKSSLEEDMNKLQAMQDEYESNKLQIDATLQAKQSEVANLDQELQAAVAAAAAEQAERERLAAEQAAKEQQAAAEQTPSSNTRVPGSNNDSNDQNDNYTPSTGGGTSSGDVSAAQAIVNAAYTQLGVPYVWGGTSAYSGLDCSGLTQYAHSMAGISIPRTSGPQGAGGVAVSNPEPGDIVCYSGHVGIYIGNGQMIHAPEPGDVVKISNVYGSPWYRRYW